MHDQRPIIEKKSTKTENITSSQIEAGKGKSRQINTRLTSALIKIRTTPANKKIAKKKKLSWKYFSRKVAHYWAIHLKTANAKPDSGNAGRRFVRCPLPGKSNTNASAEKSQSRAIPLKTARVKPDSGDAHLLSVLDTMPERIIDDSAIPDCCTAEPIL